MNLFRIGLTAMALLGTSTMATAQEATGTAGSTAVGSTSGVVATIDVSRLPIDLRQIERRFREAEIRSERAGLNLRYYVEVYGKAPNLVLFTKEDNLEHGPVPYGAPTHREMMEIVTPPEFRNHGGVNLLNPKPKKK